MSFLVTDSFLLTGRGMIVFLQNVENGLPEGTNLTSKSRNLTWKIILRQLWLHTIKEEKRFSNERETIAHASLNLSAYPNEEDPIKVIVDKHLSYGKEYLIEPIGHKEKPQVNEVLEIKV